MWETHEPGGFLIPTPCGCMLGYRAARLGCPPLSLPRAHVARTAIQGVPLLFLPLAARWGSMWPLWGGTLSPLPVHSFRVLLDGGSPDPLPHVAAC